MQAAYDLRYVSPGRLGELFSALLAGEILTAGIHPLRPSLAL
jgi:hypothetical protein